MKQKILMLSNHSGMMWKFRKELIAAVLKTDDVILAMPFTAHKKDFEKMGAKCIPVSLERRKISAVSDGKLMKCYYQLLMDERPDYVLTYSIKPNIYGGLICRWLQIPYAANVQGLGSAFEIPVLREFVSLLYYLALQGAQKVFFENREDAEFFLSRGVIPVEKEEVLPGAGVNLLEYGVKPYPNHLMIHFLYLGRIMREKGIDELLEAVRKLWNEGERFVLDLVGFFEESYEEEIRKMEMDGLIHFYGYQENPKPFYENADCVVMPSYHEGMSNVILEAAATGRPVIATRIPGCQEAVEDGKSGLLIPPGDGYALYASMKKMLHTERIKRESMGQCGRKKMEKEFGKDQVVKKTLRILFPGG